MGSLDLANSLGMFSQGSQQFSDMQAQQYNGWWNNSSAYTACTTTATVVATLGDTITLPPRKPKQHTDLEWLDKRVNEMRVAL